MRKHSILSVFLSLVIIMGLVAVSPISVNAATNITVTKFQINSKGAYKAIQDALDIARSKASDNNPYNIKIEAGSYTLNRTLRIYSNTNLQLNNVTLTKASSASINMLHIGNEDTDKVGATGYNAYKNITINGGAFNGNGGNNTLFKAAHCSNISLKGVTMRNNKAHLTEIAAVNGISFENCSFQDMVIRNNGTLTYEAIQVDILVNDHFNTYRMEDLPCKKVKVNGCTFKNCTRGVGSHTSINNAPHSDIKITNNTFTDMGSVAVQFQGVENCTIANNVIDNTPRGIAVYSVLNNGLGCYKASVLAKQGNVSQHYSDSYQTPKNANILITDNVIKRCGNVKDIYATYPAVGISAIGYNVPSNTSTLNKGNYYINGVTIKDNRIEVKGHGIRFSDARNCIADNNIITASLNTFAANANYYGITAAEGSEIPAVSNNIINKSASNGIFVVNSKCTDIINNAVLNAGKYGIAAEKSTVSRITGNTIKNSTSNGVHLNNSTVSVIRNNALANIGAHAFNLCENAVGGTITDNIVTSCNGKYYNLGGTATTGTIAESDKTSSIMLNKTALKLEVGSKATLTKTIQPNNALTTYVWSSNNNDVATVSNGVVTAKAQGTATVSVKTFNGKTASCTVTVLPAPTSIKLNRNTLGLGVGENYGLLKTVSPSDANQNVSWSSSNTNVAAADGNGKVVGKSVGRATVTAKTSNGKTALCTVTVKAAPTSVKTNPTSLKLGIGETYTISESTNSGSYANAANLRWTSSNTNIATIAKTAGTNKAMITAKKAGTTDITIKTYNGKSYTCKLTVYPAPSSVKLNVSSITLNKGKTYTISESSPSGSYANSANLKWTSSNTKVATVTKGGANKATVKAVNKGTAYIKITLYNGKTAQCKVTVK